MAPQVSDPFVLFNRKVNTGGPIVSAELGECWDWTGTVGTQGYGMFQAGGRAGKRVMAHRASWKFYVGEIPPGMFVCHKCDRRVCVRPDHIFVGTHADNMADMSAKCRHHNSAKDGCPSGHLYAGENTYLDAAGRRHCRACKRARDRRREARQ